MSVWMVFFLVVSVVILASPVLLFKSTATGGLSHRGSLKRGGAGQDRNSTFSEKGDMGGKRAGGA